MSWIRSALNKAVEIGGKNNLTHTVRNYADSVIQQAVDRAKISQDRIEGRDKDCILVSFVMSMKIPVTAFLHCLEAGTGMTGLMWLSRLPRWERANEVVNCEALVSLALRPPGPDQP